MAELVQLHIESAIPELEQMERVGLFSRTEIKKIISKRKEFEYTLRRRKKHKQDYLKYIQYEVNLLSLINMRRERLKCDYQKREIENVIATRINKLFKTVILRYQDDVKLWLSQIEFCKKMKMDNVISGLFPRMLQVHNSNPALWIMAAKWEMEENNSPENARQLLQRALRHHADFPKLWLEYFRMELMYADMLRNRREILGLQNIKKPELEVDESVLDGSVAIVVYKNATLDIQDVEFALSFLPICQKFDFTEEHVKTIFEDVQKRHPNKEETLDAVAKRPLLKINEEIRLGEAKGAKPKIVISRLESQVFETYEKAVKTVPTEKMWSAFIEFGLQRYKAAKKEKAKKKMFSTVTDLMHRASLEDSLSYDYYVQWIRLLWTNDEEKAIILSLSAARKFPTKLLLWHMCISLHIEAKADSSVIYMLFNEALDTIPKQESFSIWQLGIHWLSLKSPSKLTELFEKGIHESRDVCVPLKELYLDVSALREGIQAARSLYQRLIKLPPISPQIFKKMVQIEKAQLKPSIEHLRKCYEDAIREYGSTDVDLWLSFMRLEMEHPNGDPSLYHMLYWRAMKALLKEFTDEFVTKMTLYSTGHGLPTKVELEV